MANKTGDRSKSSSKRPPQELSWVTSDSTDQEGKPSRPDKRAAVFTLDSPVEDAISRRGGRPTCIATLPFPLKTQYTEILKQTSPRHSGATGVRSSGSSNASAMSSPGTETSSGIGVSPRSSNSLRSSDSLRISTSSGISLEDSERNVSDGSISSSGSDDLRGSRKTGSAFDVPARSSWGSSSNEDIPKGGKKIESSLMLHVKRRAKPEFMGFVDAVTLAPAKNPHNRGVRVSNFLVRSSGPHSEEESPYDDLRHHLEKLSSRHGTASLQALLTDTLPQLDYLRDMCAIADCLTAASSTIQKDAASRLERLLLITKYSEMTNATLQLFAVAHKTHEVILTPPTHDDQFLRLCGHLHLLATSALLCHSDRPLTADEWKTLTSWPKPSKKQAGEVVKQSLLKLMHVFYEHFDRHVKDLKSNAAAVRGDRKKFSKGQFCEQFVAVFCVLNEISEHRWNEPGRVLLGELRDLCDIIHKDSRNKPGNEPRTALDLLLVRGLMVLLNTSYAKVRQDVGDGKHDHPRLASELLVKVMERIDKGYHGDVTRDVSKLLFHESPLVTEVINKFLPDSRQSRLNYAFDFTENSLVVADFHVDRSGSSKHDADGGDGNSCAWHPFRGRFGQTLKVEGAVYVHIASCQAKAPHYDCVHGSQSKFSGLQPHERHMETLRQLSYHENLLRLMAYQHIPFGFYATEEVKDRRLLEQLLNHRAAHRWLDKTILCRIALDIVSALEYLASRHIASRDVTAYDMTVFGKSRRGGTSGEVIEVLASDNFIIQLANLGLAHQYRSVDAKSGEVKTVTVTEQGPIPVLWTPREAFLKGEYSDKSMVYSLGAVLYELWTHGGQPFTTQHKSTSDTLKMMLLMPDSVMLIHWPCIPDDVYGLIQRCTTSDPDKRPTLEEVHHDLEAIYQRQIHQEEECYMEAVGVTDQQYPSLMDDQVKRRYVPERGISRELQQLIEEYKRNKFENYKNLRESHQRECPENILMVTESEFYSQEWMDVCYESTGTGACTLVREKVSQTFLEDILPVLREMANAQGGSQLNGVTDWLKDPLNQPTLEQETEDHNVHERRYPVSWVLQEMATRGLLVPNDDDGYVTMGPDRYVSVFVSMARVLHDLHERGWLHRDLRASNILVDCATGQVIFMRIGRMCQVTPSVESVVGEVFEDTRRWLAPEVLLEGKYRRENDVFMLGTAFWETFHAREVIAKDPDATAINFVPFADHEKAEVVRLVLAGTPLPKPEGCPDWLYDLILQCRLPDSSQRPTVDRVLDVLLRHIPPPGRSSQRLSGGDASEQFVFPPPHPRKMTSSSEPIIVGEPSYPPEPPKRHRAHKVRLYVGDVAKRVLDSSGTTEKPYLVQDAESDCPPPLPSKERRPSLPNALDVSKSVAGASASTSEKCTYLTPTFDLWSPDPQSRSRSNTLPSKFRPKGQQPQSGAATMTRPKVPGLGISVKSDSKTKVFTRCRSEGSSGYPPGGAGSPTLPKRDRTQSDPPCLDAVREHEEDDHVYDQIREDYNPSLDDPNTSPGRSDEPERKSSSPC